MKKIIFAFFFLLLHIVPLFSFAKMNILTIERSPFSFHEGKKLTGFSLDLLEAISKRTGLAYTLHEETSFSEMLNKIKNKKADCALANISITAEREKNMDFSHPIYESGIQLLVKKQDTSLFSFQHIKTVFLIILVLLLLSWGIKRIKNNTTMLGNIPSSAYLMIVWIIWWWWLVISFSSHLLPEIQAQGDRDPLPYLRNKEIGTSKWTTMSKFLDKNNIKYHAYDDYNTALDALEKWEIQTLLGDAAVTKYYAHHEGKEKVQLVWDVFEEDSLGIACKTRFNLLKKINQALLQIKEDGSYEKLMLKYFGEEY